MKKRRVIRKTMRYMSQIASLILAVVSLARAIDDIVPERIEEER